MVVSIAGTATAQSFRCGVQLVNLGDTEGDVRNKCGDPVAQVRNTFKRRRIITTHDQWIYNLGPTEFLRILTFDAIADRLIEIRLGEYGR